MRVTVIEKLTPERIFRYFDHLSAGNLKTDNLQVLENEVREGPNEAVVDEQVLDDRVRAGVRTQSLRQKRKIDGLTLDRQTLSFCVDVAEAAGLEVRGRTVVSPRTLRRNFGRTK